MITRAFNVKSRCTPSMLKSKLIKLIFFERKEVRLLYIGATGFQSHTSPTIFALLLCLLCLYYGHYAYYDCTMSTIPVPCLLCLQCQYYAYYDCAMPTIPVPCLLCLCYVCYAYNACTMPTMRVYNHPKVTPRKVGVGLKRRRELSKRRLG